MDAEFLPSATCLLVRMRDPSRNRNAIERKSVTLPSKAVLRLQMGQFPIHTLDA